MTKEQQIGARDQRLHGGFDRSRIGQRIHLEAIRDEHAIEAKLRPKEIGQNAARERRRPLRVEIGDEDVRESTDVAP